MQKLSIDLGYGYTKGMSGNGKTIVFPSIFGAGYKRDMATLFGAGVEINPDNIHIKLEDDSTGESEFFVGELARKESRAANYIYNDNKIHHVGTKVLLAAATALLTDDGEDLLLVTGVPLEYHNRQKTEFETFLKSLSMKVTLFGGHVEVRRHVKFDHVFVYPQAAGATYELIKQEESLLDQTGALIGVIDIGHKTTDYIVFEVGRRLEVMQSLSGTLKAGISVLHNYLGQEYYRKAGIHLKPIDAERLIQNKGVKSIFGEQQDFSVALHEGIKEIARHIQDNILAKWDYRFDDFPAVYLAGGGAYLLYEQLKGIHRRVQIVDDAQFANVKGFMSVATVHGTHLKAV